jgi:predicted nucleic acid-binding protein
MAVEYVLDTNVLIYAISSASEDKAKRERSLALVAAGHFGVSGQILQEFFVTATRKIRTKLTAAEALALVIQLAEQPCVATDAALVMRAIETSVAYQISYWDGAILAAAEALGAPVLFTEDLNHGQSYGAVKVVNPFLGA